MGSSSTVIDLDDEDEDDNCQGAPKKGAAAAARLVCSRKARSYYDEFFSDRSCEDAHRKSRDGKLNSGTCTCGDVPVKRLKLS